MIRQDRVLIITAIIALAASAAPAAELHVGPGQTYTTIQSAIDAAANGDTVIVADGTYTGDGNRDIDFKGKAIIVKSENGPENCIIDCQATADEPHLGFLIFSDGARIDGFTITGGRPKSDPRSGAITIRGGGIYVHMVSNVVVSNCVVARNEGHGIDWHAYSVISDCVVCDNSGNGVSLRAGTLKRSRIHRNGLAGVSFGGGTVEDCVISENGRGVSGSGEVVRCKIQKNRGEGIRSEEYTSTITLCEVVGNGEVGVMAYNSSVTVNNCLIAENKGGGIKGPGHTNDTTRVYNCTIANNTSDQYGGGITSMQMQVVGCILYGNWGGGAPQIYVIEHTGSNSANSYIRNCLVQGGRNGAFEGAGVNVSWTSIIDDDPNFAFENDYHLRVMSPCKNRGDLEDAPPYDLDGNSRYVGGHNAEWGAYEYTSDKSTIALSNDELEFSMPLGGASPADQVFAIRNVGGQPLNWTVEEACEWVEVMPESGILSADDVVPITVKVSGEALAHGKHVCLLTFRDAGASNSPRIVSVTLDVRSTLRVPQDYDTIQEALDDAVDGDVVVVGDGRYRGDGNRDLDMKGKAIHLKSENGPRNCIIDCQGTASDRHRGFIFETTEDDNSIVDGFSIMNGYANWGGAIYCDRSSPLITNCVIFGNTGSMYSSAVSLYWGSNATITNCLIVGNHGKGPAVSGRQSNPRIINSTIAMNTSSVVVGGIRLDEGTLSLINSIVWGNRDKTGNGQYSQILTAGPGYESPKHEHTYYYNCIEGWGTDPNGIGNFESDPLFVDPIDGDFHLMAGSPCIDAGDPNGNYLPDINVDFEHDKRISFGRIDIGADEYVSYDLRGDGMINLGDLAVFSSYWCKDGCAGPEWCGGADFSSNGLVGLPDLTLFAGNWLVENKQTNLLVVGHWKLDEISGNTTTDNSMYLRNGMLVNMDDTDWVQGKAGNGNALEFDGVDDFVEITGFAGVLGGRSRTVCAWIRTNTPGRTIVGWGYAAAGNRWTTVVDSAGHLRLEAGGGAIVGSTPVSDGDWHHVAVVLENDGSPNINEVKLYVDGLPDEPSSNTGDRAIDTLAGSDVTIGQYYGTSFFEGTIDEVHIYDRALTADEIAALAQ